MSSGYKCDLTGKLFEGTGLGEVVVEIRDDLRLVVTPKTRLGQTIFQRGHVSKETADEITMALQDKFGKPAPKPEPAAKTAKK